MNATLFGAISLGFSRTKRTGNYTECGSVQPFGVALGRFGQPIQAAMAILFLPCDEASFITGANLVMDSRLQRE